MKKRQVRLLPGTLVTPKPSRHTAFSEVEIVDFRGETCFSFRRILSPERPDAFVAQVIYLASLRWTNHESVPEEQALTNICFIITHEGTFHWVYENDFRPTTV